MNAYLLLYISNLGIACDGQKRFTDLKKHTFFLV